MVFFLPLYYVSKVLLFSVRLVDLYVPEVVHLQVRLPQVPQKRKLNALGVEWQNARLIILERNSLPKTNNFHLTQYSYIIKSYLCKKKNKKNKRKHPLIP